MNEKIPNYIVPIYQFGKFIGTGFIVDDSLFTAQHVGLGRYKDGQSISALVNGKTYSLLTSAALFSYGDIDTMAFRLVNKDFESPLHFADKDPVYDSGKGEPILYQSCHFQPLEDGRFMYRETNCVVMQETRDQKWRFDACNYDRTIGGASGSPLIKDNLIYGMLVSGRVYSADYCAEAKKEVVAAGILNEEQAEAAISVMNNNNTYVKGCIIKQAYERDLKNNPKKKILPLNEMFA